MIRRTLFWVLSIAAAGLAGWQLAWSPEFFGGAAQAPLSVAGIAVFVVAIAFVAWSYARPAGWKVLVAFGLGITGALLAQPLWGLISWTSLGWLALGLVILLALWAGTIVTYTTMSSLRSSQRRPSTAEEV